MDGEDASPDLIARRQIRRRAAGLAASDAVAWLLAVVLAWGLRVDFEWQAVDFEVAAALGLLAVLLHWNIGVLAGIYGGSYRIGTLDEAGALVTTLGSATIGLVALNFAFDRPAPASVPLLGGLVAALAASGARVGWRRFRERSLRPDVSRASRVVVVGAGDAAMHIVRQLMATPGSDYLPVAFVDDDPAKRNLRVAGVRVLGTRRDLLAVAEQMRATHVLVAIPSASTQFVREVAAEAEQAGLQVQVLPTLHEFLEHPLTIADIRPLAEADLLGREPVRIDVGTVSAAIRDRRVLVVGAGGSIGAELCKQLAPLGPSELMMLDRDESGLHATALSVRGETHLRPEDLVVADIRDAPRMREVFTRFRPDVVFHAAALKHLTMLELHPGEALKTNVHGTENVLRAALESGVERFVNISTDKAADPVSVLGYSKRMGERLTAWAGEQGKGAYVSVRFGNVLGSRGSILTTFQAQIAGGHPVTVTHPHVTRFFMTVEEACLLVMQAAAIGRQGEVLVLDMGEPIRIVDLADRLTAQSSSGTETTYTGLRSGEKLHEVLFAHDEQDERPFHSLVGHVAASPLDPSAYVGFETLSDEALLVALANVAGHRAKEDEAGAVETPFVVLDDGGRLSSANVAARRLLGMHDEQLVGMHMSDLALRARNADGSPVNVEALVGYIGQGPPDRKRDREDPVVGFVRHDGSIVWISGTAISQPDQGAKRTMLMFHEIDWDPDPTRPEVIAAMARVSPVQELFECVGAKSP